MIFQNLTQIQLVFLLLLVFQLKHFLSDYPLQNKYMLNKERADWGFLLPLMSHSLVHASITLVILLVFRAELWWIFLFDFSVHFIMDRIKSGPKYWGRYNNVKKASFWRCFGIDQMVHHLTHYVVIYAIVFY